MMDDVYYPSRRQFLRTLAATGVIAAGSACATPPKHGPITIRFQFSIPDAPRTSLVESLVDRFNRSQKDIEVKLEFVPQAQARQKLKASLSAGDPPDCCQIWDSWLAEFDRMDAVEDLTRRVEGWRHYSDTVPAAWQTVTVKGRILSLPWAVTNDAIYIRADRAKEYGITLPEDDWTWDDFLHTARVFTKPERNQFGFGMRGQGTWAVLHATEFMYGNGAQVLKDGKAVINSQEAVEGLKWYLDLFRTHKVAPPSVPTDGWRQIVQNFGRGVTNMYLHNSGSSEEQKKLMGSRNFVTVPLPLGPARTRGSFLFAETLTMMKGSRNKEATWEFFSFLMDDEQHARYAKSLGLLPVRRSIAERPDFAGDPALAGFVKSFPFSMNPYLAYASWGSIVDSEGVVLFQKALSGKITAKECLDKFAEALTRTML